MYCDLYGLHLFGGAFLYAFDYLLGPGSANRSPSYPSDAQRIGFMSDLARDLKLDIDPVLVER